MNDDEGLHGGMITLSRWPMKYPNSQVAKANHDRSLVTYSVLRCRRPVRVANLYLKPDDPAAATKVGEEIIHEALVDGDNAILLGDWNRMLTEELAAAAIATGQVHAADEVVAGASAIATHRRRHIDYAIVKEIFPTGREQHEAREFDDLIIYEFDTDRAPSAPK